MWVKVKFVHGSGDDDLVGAERDEEGGDGHTFFPPLNHCGVVAGGTNYNLLIILFSIL